VCGPTKLHVTGSPAVTWMESGMNSLTIAWISVSDGSQPASGNSYVSPSYSVSPALAASKASISGRAAASISRQTCADRAFIGGRSRRIVPTRRSSSTSRRTNSPTVGLPFSE
jgi:hypothetical protein